jgi:hypothetical protein
MKIFFLQILLITSAIFAQESQFESTTGLASFLKRGFSARWVGMGGAPIALVQDASSIYWNPAGLVNEKKFQLNLSRVKETVFSDIQFNQVAISYSNYLFKKYHFGIGIGYLDARVGGIDLYDNEANYVGSSHYSEAIILGGAAISLGELKIGFSHINYMVNNLGMSQSTTLNTNKNYIMLGLQYYIFKGLNVGVSIRNKAELLPNEYLESQRKIGISYSRNRASSNNNLFNFGLDLNKVAYGGLLSSGLEFFPLRNLAISMGISNVKIIGLSDNKILDYRQKLSIGIGYAYSFSNKFRIRLSASISQHLYPSINESWIDPFSRNTLISISID